MKSRKAKLMVAIVALFTTGTLVWPLVRADTPEDDINAMRRTGGNDAKTRAIYVKRLMAQGPRAIPSVIEAIRNGGTRSRRTWQLNNALTGLGKPAHQQMLQAIDRETDAWKRIHLVDSLQQAFGDFSRVHLWLKHVKRNPFSANWMRLQFIEKFQDNVPFIFINQKEDQFNPQFVKWYQRKMVPRGPLPHWQP